ncbi:MAG: hypothetical protein Tp136SUR676911_8 [Prokaryotic dsDNA virus sp.]|jgi:hypothetical protein|nr:MAG: hypothetical protein Tp136SUR676911_8 [Prokaryotic dsDNA virus sp.]|tara:strand:+ start:4798 stop:6354 length:1557 start_codon:yes stop_codon:yes gene_type:complete
MNETQKKDLLAAKEIAKRESIAVPLASKKLHENNVNLEQYWPEPLAIGEDSVNYSDVDLITHGGWLGEFATSVASSIQFPANTAFLHLLGIMSCATAKSFRYEYYGDSASVNLYAVTAQPSSSGKSGIHKRYATPFQVALSEFNRLNAVEKAKIDKEIDDLEKQIAQREKDGQADTEMLRELADLQEKGEKYNRIEFAFDDITPEAAEAAAVRQGGLINIASAEADALNIILGDVYKGQSSKANYGMFLKTWDTEWHSPSRITRNTKAGFVYGSVAVIAQQAAIESILQAGMSGRGISERMLLLSERPVLGHRDHTKYTPVNNELKERYGHLCRNIIFEREPVLLKLDSKSMDLIVAYRQEIEPKLADDGEYSNAMIRGAMGKADKQIIKIASLLHIAEEWQGEQPRRKPFITVDCVKRAIEIFEQLSQTYIQAAARLGFAGEETEVLCLIEALERYAKKRKMKITVRQFRDAVKNLKPMQNVPNVTQRIREILLPKVEGMGYVAIEDEQIYINPKLK